MGPQVLVTGATGLLGREVLTALVRRGWKVRALVRPRTYDKIIARGIFGHAVRAFDRSSSDTDQQVVEAVKGDIRLPLFGLDPELHRRLAAATQVVVHCAGATKFDLPERQYLDTNVNGALHVVEFCRRCPPSTFRGLYHVSTVYVGGCASKPFTEEDHDIGQRFNNTYERTKFLAECAVKAAFNDGLPGVIIRPAIIVGRTSDGATSEFTTIYPVLRVLTRGLVRSIPGHLDATLNLVPIDYVVTSIEQVVTAGLADGRTLHLLGFPDVTIGEMREVMSEYPSFHIVEVVNPEAFHVQSLVPIERRVYLRFMTHYDAYFQGRVAFADERSRHLLREYGITSPRTDRTFFRRLLDYCVAVGYL